MNARVMSYHKKIAHRQQQHCNLTVVDDGQQQSSGMLCKKTQALSDHKRRDRKRKHALGEEDELSPSAD
ncbi:hypothetical protein [Endozoicomonas sp. 2B-B]